VRQLDAAEIASLRESAEKYIAVARAHAELCERDSGEF
jgi:hypothetical protein